MGRADEFSYATERLGESSGVRGIVLAGAAGVGKTRLAHELLDRHRAAGGTTRLVIATAAARSVPLGPFASTLTLDESLATSATSLFGTALTQLRTLAAAENLVLAVDDAHLLDEMSALLVQQLVLAGVPAVLTLRSAMPASDAIVSLWKDGVLARLDLQPLARAELDELLTAVLEAPVEHSALQRIWCATAGNVLFARELIASARASGVLRRRAGVWRLDGQIAPGPTLQEQVDARLGTVDQKVRELLEILALAEPLPASMCRELVGIDAIDAAEDQVLVVTQHDTAQLRLAHPIFGEAVRARLSEPRVRRVYGLLSQAVRAADLESGTELLRRAVWLMRSGEPVTDERASLLVAAAVAASHTPDFGLAEELAARAASVRSPCRFDARLIIAHAARWTGRLDEADQLYAELFEQADNDLRRVRVLNVRAFGLHFGLHRFDDARALLDRAEHTIENPALRLLVPAIRAAIGVYGRDARTACETAARVLAQPGAPYPAVQWSAIAAIEAGAATGDTRRADDAVAALERIHAEGPVSPFERATGELARHNLFLTRGCVDEAEQRALSYQASIIDSLDKAGISIAAYLRASTDLARGRPRSATRWAREALSEETLTNLGDLAVRAGIVLTIAGAQRRDPQAIADGLDAIHSLAPGFERCEPDRILAHAWVAAARGERSQARALALNAAELAKHMGHDATVLTAATTALRFGSRMATDLLASTGPRVAGAFAPLVADYASAWSERDGASLERASCAFEALGFELHAADAAAHAATAHHTTGHHAAALAATTRARNLQTRCEDAHTMALDDSTDPFSLTDREREIVDLARAGLTNREIARRLIINVRTVEGHLNRAFAKLGINSRQELTDFTRAT